MRLFNDPNGPDLEANCLFEPVVLSSNIYSLIIAKKYVCASTLSAWS